MIKALRFLLWKTEEILTVGQEWEGQRLDNFLLRELRGAPKTLVYRIIRSGEVRVNKGRAKAETKLQTGDVLRIPPLRLSEKPAVGTIKKEAASARPLGAGRHSGS